MSRTNSESKVTSNSDKKPMHRPGLPPSREFYNMNHKHRGVALIFSHDKYDTDLDMNPRTGADKDLVNLCSTFKKLDFHVEDFTNLTYAEIMKHIKRTSKMNHSNNDCLLIFVLTHGNNGTLYARDTYYTVDKLWNSFNARDCPSLAGKPKLFFIQACQGDEYDDGVRLLRDVETDGWFAPHTNPTEPDFLVARSTVPGYYAWRNKMKGSWFCLALCEEVDYVINKAPETDILTLLTGVCQRVALDHESRTDDVKTNAKRQVPSISSMLTRRLVFSKKMDREKLDAQVTNIEEPKNTYKKKTSYDKCSLF